MADLDQLIAQLRLAEHKLMLRERQPGRPERIAEARAEIQRLRQAIEQGQKGLETAPTEEDGGADQRDELYALLLLGASAREVLQRACKASSDTKTSGKPAGRSTPFGFWNRRQAPSGNPHLETAGELLSDFYARCDGHRLMPPSVQFQATPLLLQLTSDPAFFDQLSEHPGILDEALAELDEVLGVLQTKLESA